MTEEEKSNLREAVEKMTKEGLPEDVQHKWAGCWSVADGHTQYNDY